MKNLLLLLITLTLFSCGKEEVTDFYGVWTGIYDCGENPIDGVCTIQDGIDVNDLIATLEVTVSIQDLVWDFEGTVTDGTYSFKGLASEGTATVSKDELVFKIITVVPFESNCTFTGTK